MAKPRTANLFGGIAGLLVAALTMYISYTKLRQPQIFLDWAALLFSGLTTGIITFFIVWGHFQRDPEPAKNREES